MDNTVTDEEKCTTIRQTIRRVIIPLVQAIYEDEPPDIMQFCYQYFENQLRIREKNEKDVADGCLHSTEALSKVNEASENIQKTRESRDTTGNLSTIIQGSSSDPLLTGEKYRDGVSLRGTSSWDLTPSHSKLDGSRLEISDISDAKCGIGDQPCPVKMPVGRRENDAKAGDVEFIPKRKEKTFENDNILQNEISVMDEIQSSEKPVQEAIVSPSAPSYAEQNRHLRTVLTGLENSKDNIQKSETKRQNDNLTSRDVNTGVTSDTLSKITRCSSSDQCSDLKDFEICPKPLSPNSSFGFIPHLKESDTRQETHHKSPQIKSSKDSDFERKTSAEIPELAEQFSEALQDLAKKFTSAETNLDAEFQNAKEISDIIHGRCQVTHSREEDGSVLNGGKCNASLEENKSGSSIMNRDHSDVIMDENNNNNNLNNTIEGFCESEREVLNDKAPEIIYVKETDGEIRSMQGLREENKIKYEPSECERTTEEQNIREPDSETRQREKNSNLRQKNIKDDQSRLDSFNSHPVVDEAWRKRWYEAHPGLDNISSKFRQMLPNVHRANRFCSGGRGKPNTKNIGEAGDVPLDYDRSNTLEGNAARNLKYSEPNNGIERNTNFSPVMEESNSQEKLLVDEVPSGETVRVARNIPDKDLTGTVPANVCSPNIPYAWRKMSKIQTSYLETEKQVLKQLTESYGDFNNSKNKSTSDSKATDIHDTLSKNAVAKELSKNNSNDVANKQSVTPCNTEQVHCEERKYLQNFRDNMNKKFLSTPLGKNDFQAANEFEGKNLSVSKENKNLKANKACMEEDCDTDEKKQKFCHEAEKKANFDNGHDLKEYKHKDLETDHSRKERDKVLYDNNAAMKTDICENTKGEFATNGGLLSEVKDQIRSHQRIDDSSKFEPGLNSAGGDFTLSNIPENGEQANLDPRSQNGPIDSHRTEAQEITTAFVEEVIGRVMQEDSLSDNYEGLNFSSCSESESSNMESDFSETEDPNLYSRMFEPGK